MSVDLGETPDGGGGAGTPGVPGTPGVSPHIGGNGHWFIGAVDTGLAAQGPPGPSGGGGGGGGPLTQPFLRPGLIIVGPATELDPVFFLPVPWEIVDVAIGVSEAPLGADLVTDMNLNGVTLFTTQANRPRVPAGALRSVAVTVPDITTIPAYARVTIEDDGAGTERRGRNRLLIMRYTTA